MFSRRNKGNVACQPFGIRTRNPKWLCVNLFILWVIDIVCTVVVYRVSLI